MTKNTSTIFEIAFEYQGTQYRGKVTPANQNNGKNEPPSYIVVLNDVFFGQLSFNDCQWTINEPKSQKLVEAAGKQIEDHYKL